MSLLCIYGILIPLKIYNITLITGILRAGGDVKFAMKTEVSAIWLISVPLVFIGALLWKLPIFAVVILAQTEDFVKCVILTKRFYSRKCETRLELKKNCSTFATERRDKDYDGVKFIAIKFLRME